MAKGPLDRPPLTEKRGPRGSDEYVARDWLPMGETYPGLITGMPVKPTGTRGRPRYYVNADARKLHARLREVEQLLAKLSMEVGFTDFDERAMRGRFKSVSNQLNRNINKKPHVIEVRPEGGQEWSHVEQYTTREEAIREASRMAAEDRDSSFKVVLAATRKNPEPVVHVAAHPFGPSGEMLPLCGTDAAIIYVPTSAGLVASSPIMVTEWPDLATCGECRREFETK